MNFKEFFLIEKAKLVWRKKDAKGIPFFFKGKRTLGKWVWTDPEAAIAARLEVVGNRFKKSPKPKIKKISAKDKLLKKFAAKKRAKKGTGKKKLGAALTRKKKERFLQKISKSEQS